MIRKVALVIAGLCLASMWALADGQGESADDASTAKLSAVPAGQAASEPATQAADDKSAEGKSEEKEKKDALKRQEEIIKAVMPSQAMVEYTLQLDKGEGPDYGGGECIDEERPMEMVGYFLSPTTVITADPSTHPRFIKSIAVRVGQQVIDAKIAGYYVNQPALLIELSSPAKDVKPLTFDAKAKKPYYNVRCDDGHNGLWMMSVASMNFDAVSNLMTGKNYAICGIRGGLITDSAGTPVGMSYVVEFPTEDSWKGSPDKWEMLKADEMAKTLGGVEKVCDGGIVRAALSFRSPKKDLTSRYNDDDDGATEQNVPGVIVDEKTVMIVANMTAKITARLERINIHTGDGKSVPAKFKATLKDYGVFLAELEKPIGKPVQAENAKVTDFENAMLISADVRIQGETRTAYYNRSRIYRYSIGWKKNIYPRISGGIGMFAFTREGKMLTVDIARRKKVASEDRYGSRDTSDTPMSMVMAAIKDLANNIDPNNIPLSEEEENRIAWLGVEVQAMDTELARINNVSNLTSDGRTGAMVAYVYPGSPAEKAGIKVGDIILRVQSAEIPKPIDLVVRDTGFSGEFPWDRYDELPERYYDRVPKPWPSVENTLNRILTDIGFGKKFSLDIVRDGKTESKEFEVVQSPSHYDSAAKYKSEPLGLTVKDMTYEVRRYFQKKDDEPGVIVGKIEPGSKVSVAGLKPYEIVTHVNDTPVKNVKDFETAVDAAKNAKEMRLQVMRMTKGRVVKVKLDGAGSSSQPTSEPTTAPADTQGASSDTPAAKAATSKPAKARPKASDDEDE